MNLDWDKQTRMAAAKEILSQAIEKLRGVEDLEIALRVYGHQSMINNEIQDCNDTKLEVPFGKDRIDAIKLKVKGLTGKGATPIARSLEAAAGDFPDTLARNFIILITDGLESCDNDPCVVAKKLREKGVKVTPFVIGLGMDLSYLEKFNCIGTFIDAESKDSFKTVLTNIIQKTLINTSVQINLNTTLKTPTETNVSIFLYEAGTKKLKYSFMHTLNRYGNPDTLILDPTLKYDLVVNTLPKLEKKNLSIKQFMHNTIEVDAGQGFLKFSSAISNEISNLNMRVMLKGQTTTLNEQTLNSTQKYLVGSYDVEIFTLPRTYKTIEITQSKTTTINVIASGTLNYTAEKGLIGQIFTDKGDQTFEWVCDLKEGFNKDLWNLQPGSYKVIYREKDQKSIAYTKEKNFKIESNKSISLNL
ncbi:MAG: VWA domain-containing protein [Flavobacteriales bacterium]|nr:VWA domain-containing protein [Flavobacteriales bacterium]